MSRQGFVMLYGSFEAFLFHIFERAFRDLGTSNNILEDSIELITKKKWDGKFCSMRDKFGVDYRSGDLIDHFRGFKMKFENKEYLDPLDFLDKLAQVRHRIVHASSILPGDKLISIQPKFSLGAHAFYAHLTDYVDDLFATKYGYERRVLDPAEA